MYGGSPARSRRPSARRRRSGHRRPRSGPPGAPRSVRPARSGSASARARPLGPERPAATGPARPLPVDGILRPEPLRHRRRARLVPDLVGTTDRLGIVVRHAYSRSPTASRASPLGMVRPRTTFPSRTVHTCQNSDSTVTPAAFAPSPLVDTNHDRIPGINHIPELVAPFIERSDPTAKNSLTPAGPCHVPPESGMSRLPTSHRTSSSKTSQARSDRAELVEHTQDQLHVLLRHRLPREPGGFEGLGRGQLLA